MDKSPYARTWDSIIDAGFFAFLFVMIVLTFIVVTIEYGPPLELSCDDGTVLICYSAEAGYGENESWACGTSRVPKKTVVLPSGTSCSVRQHGR